MSNNKKNFGFCRKCGTPFSEDDIFCEECGYDLRKTKENILKKKQLKDEEKKDTEEKEPSTKTSQKQDKDEEKKVAEKKETSPKTRQKQVKKIKKPVLVGVVVLCLLGVFAGYSFLGKKDNSKDDDNKITKDQLEMTFLDGKKQVELSKQKRKKDKDGVKEKQYQFTIQNTDEEKKDYSVLLDNIDEEVNTIKNEYVKYSLTIDGEQQEIYQIEDQASSVVLDSGVLKKNEKKNYELSIWLDSEAPSEVEKGKFVADITMDTKKKEISTYQANQFTADKRITGEWHLNNHVISEDDSSLMTLFGSSLTQVGNKLTFRSDGTYEMSVALAYNESGKYQVDKNGTVTLSDIKYVDGSVEHQVKKMEYVEYQGVSFLKFDITDYQDKTYIYFEKTNKSIGSSEIPEKKEEVKEDKPEEKPSNSTSSTPSPAPTSGSIKIDRYTFHYGTYKLDDAENYGGWNEQLVLKENGKCVYTSSSSYGTGQQTIGTVDCTYTIENHDWAQDASHSSIRPSLKITYRPNGYSSDLSDWFFAMGNNKLGQEMFSLSLRS